MTDPLVGAELPDLRAPEVTRATLALFAGASGDHNPCTSTPTRPARPASTTYRRTACSRWRTSAGS